MDSASSGDRAERTVVLFFDGGSRGNPGPAYGSFLYRLSWNGTERAQLDFAEVLTNNQAEYRTLIAALDAVLAKLRDQSQDPKTITLLVYTDSELLTRQLQGKYKIRNPHLKPLAEYVQSLFAQFKEWHIQWQPRRVIYSYFGH